MNAPLEPATTSLQKTITYECQNKIKHVLFVLSQLVLLTMFRSSLRTKLENQEQKYIQRISQKDVSKISQKAVGINVWQQKIGPRLKLAQILMKW